MSDKKSISQNKRHNIISIGIFIIILVAIIKYVAEHPELTNSLRQISPLILFYLLVAQIIFLATNGLFLKLFVEKFNINLSTPEWFGLAVVTAMGNYLTPFSGGTIFRALYLNRKHVFPYQKFILILAANYLIIFEVIGLLGLLTLFLSGQMGTFLWLSTFFVGLSSGVLFLMIIPKVQLPPINRLTTIVNTVLEGWYIIKQDQALLLKSVGYTLLHVLSNCISFWLAYTALGVAVPFWAAILVSLIAMCSIVIKITPGNLGIQELAISLSTSLIGFDANEGLIMSLLIRMSSLLIIFTAGPIFSLWLTKKLR